MDTKSSLANPSPTSLRNRNHRKRFSVNRLSTDSTATLPVYLRTEISPDDQPPPDYPESADEADADTDTGHSTSSEDTLLPLASPRHRRLHTHRRRRTISQSVSSPTDPYLDSLLARSVHALEMSNALLQSSISTQSSLSAVLAADSPVVESSLEARARGLSSRIGANSGVHESWLDDLAVISEHQEDALGLSLGHDDAISTSLPVGPSPLQLRASSHRRNRSTCNLRQISREEDERHLRLSNWPRSRLISPAPRAMTQYVECNADPDTILLPSTLGLRSASSAHLPPRSPCPPCPPKPPSTVSTLLSSFLMRRPSTSSTTSRPSSTFPFAQHPRASTSCSRASSTADSTPFSSPARSRAGKRAMTPQTTPSLVLPTRPLTPPTENPSLSSLSSSSSSSNPSSDPHINPVRSLQALRKILDDQPSASSMSRTQSAPRRQTFLPRTPLPAPTLGTSTATASVSRLFTKPVHMHSGSSSREPRPSALKGGWRTPQSPASPDGFLVPGHSTGPGGSSGSSARSTPKRISFADLPEPYASERGGGGSGRGFEKRSLRRGGKKRGGKGKGKGKGKSRVGVDDDSDESDDDDDDFEKGWWARLLLGPGQVRGSLSIGRPEDRLEARMARGRGGFGNGMEDWAV